MKTWTRGLLVLAAVIVILAAIATAGCGVRDSGTVTFRISFESSRAVTYSLNYWVGTTADKSRLYTGQWDSGVGILQYSLPARSGDASATVTIGVDGSTFNTHDSVTVEISSGPNDRVAKRCKYGKGSFPNNTFNTYDCTGAV